MSPHLRAADCAEAERTGSSGVGSAKTNGGEDMEEQNDRFIEDVLLASLPIEGGVEGQPQEHAGEVINIHKA